MSPGGHHDSDGPALPARPLRVTHHIGGTYAGSTRVVLDLLRLHDRRCFEPSVIYGSIAPPDPRVIAETERLGVPWREVTKRGRYDVGVMARTTLAFRSLGTEVAVLHGFGGYVFGGGGAFLARVPARVRVEHNPELYNAGYRLATRVLGQLADSTILVSRHLLDYLHGLGLPPPRPEVIYNGIALDPFLAVTRRPFSGGGVPTVLMAARLDTQKDQATLVAAVARLKARGVAVRLRLAGVGSEEERLRQQIAQLGVGDRIELLGFRGDLPALLEEADIAALITHYEGFGLAAAEGMAAARPVVLTRVASLPELIDDGREGLLTDHASPDSVADALERLVRDPAAAAAMGEAGRRRASERFSLTVSARAVDQHLLRTAALRGLIR